MADRTFSTRRLVALLVATAFAFMTLDARETGPFSGARSVTLTATAPLRSALGWLVSPISAGWQGVVHYDDVEEENNLLRSQIAELEGQLAQVPGEAEELRALREATGIDYAAQYPRVTGRVVSDRQTGLERIVEINVGSNDGIDVGMPVVTGNGLVGQVISTSGGRSAVRVLTDPRLQVGVVSNRSRIVGVTSGRGDGNNLLLDMLDNASDQSLNRTRFETSGFDASPYPGGIPVGLLIVEESGLVSLRPTADLEQLSYLTVLIYRYDDAEVDPLVDPDEQAPVDTVEVDPNTTPETSDPDPSTADPDTTEPAPAQEGSDG